MTAKGNGVGPAETVDLARDTIAASSPAGKADHPACPPVDATDSGRGRRGWVVRLGLLSVLVLGLTAFLLLDGPALLSFETLGRHHEAIAAWVAAHRLIAVLTFVAVYVMAVTFSVPGAVWMSIAGGYLFGPLPGTVLIVVSATLGATTVFLAARTILGEGWRQRAFSGGGQRLAQRLRDNAFSGLLVLRLVPLFPFWLVNLVPAFLDMPLRSYVLATLLGIIPGAAVFASVGSGLDHVLAAGETPDLTVLYDPHVLGPLLGLAALAMVPTLWRRWKGPDG